jgi:alpha-glucosidase
LERLGKLQSWQVKGRSLVIACGWETQLTLTPAFHGVVEVRLRRPAIWQTASASPSVSVNRESWPETAPPQVTARPDHLLAGFPGVTVRVERAQVRLSWWEAPGQTGSPGPARPDPPVRTAVGRVAQPPGLPLLADGPAGGIYTDGWASGVRFTLHPDDHFYGLGQPDQNRGPIPLDQRGTRHRIWNKHQPAPARMVMPVLVSSRGYGLFIDNPWAAEWDLGTDGASFGYEAQGGDLVYYFIAGPSLPQILERYTRLTGRPALPPRWTFGLIQSKYGYRNRQEVEDLVATFREKEIPLDCVVLDLFWFRKMGDLRFDRAAFPRPEQLIGWLREQGIRVITIEEPYVLKGSRLFPEAERLGLFGRQPDGSPYIFTIWAGEGGLVDFTQPFARHWWAEQHEPLFAAGISGWWTDLTEPEVHPHDMVHHGGIAPAVHNVYASYMLQSLAMAQQQFNPEGRLFVMSRAGWPGVQALGASHWSGDINTNWEALANQPVLGLLMGTAGMPYWNTDIGGFRGQFPSPELYVRWFQFGVFTPTVRPHGELQAREPWLFGPEAEATVIRYIRLRYQLLPYTYTLAHQAWLSGMPLMRPLLLQYPDDPKGRNLTDQYLWGADLLIAPVLAEGASSRPVYLPEGDWYDFWSPKRFAGGRQVTVRAPLETLPLFVRAGAIIPMAPVRRHTGPLDELTLAVYPGPDQSQFELYEDDGETTAYREGAYATTLFTCQPSDGRLTIGIGRTNGSCAGQPDRRSYRLAVRLPSRPVSVAADSTPVPPRRAAAGLADHAGGWWYDRQARVLHVSLPPSPAERTVTVHTQS